MKSVFTIRLLGDLDAVTIEPYSSVIDKLVTTITSPSIILLDFSQVPYMNSTAIGNIAHWYSLFQDKESEVHMIGLSENIYDTLDLVGLLHIIPHHTSLEAFKKIIATQS
ncbi:MAG: STAS domain-containing protein [Candidatus Gracilibacteria bacterium]|jgi:anti-anti-sigma factor